MGEIGIERKEYLFELNFIDLLLIERGYARRCRNLWSATRWQTYHLMAAFCGGKGLKESGLNSPIDLLPLPWDTKKSGGPLPTKEEQEDLKEMMNDINLNGL